MAALTSSNRSVCLAMYARMKSACSPWSPPWSNAASSADWSPSSDDESDESDPPSLSES